MLREKCRTCGGTDLYKGRMMGQVSVTSPRSIWKATPVRRCVVCVSCGGVDPYLDDAAIARIKSWKAAESHDLSPMPEAATDDARQQSIVILLMVVAAIIGIAAAVLVPIFETAQKIK